MPIQCIGILSACFPNGSPGRIKKAPNCGKHIVFPHKFGTVMTTDPTSIVYIFLVCLLGAHHVNVQLIIGGLESFA